MRLHTELDVDWKNIFPLWREAREVLPIRVVKSGWSADAGHCLVVERVEIGQRPYGSAWGQYHWRGELGRQTRKSTNLQPTRGACCGA